MEREIKFKLLFKNKEGDIISSIYTLDELIDKSEETIYEELEPGCSSGGCYTESQNFCDCGGIYEDYVLFKKLPYIGVKDKTEKEIYEGSVISFKANYTSNPYGWLEGVIIWHEHSWKFQSSEGCVYDLEEESDEGRWQWSVLGNIHENPELLNTEK